jgi:hypothetical protein
MHLETRLAAASFSTEIIYMLKDAADQFGSIIHRDHKLKSGTQPHLHTQT